MAKKYISANIAIVRLHSNIIATSGPEMGGDLTENPEGADPWGAPERRYRRNYGNNYSEDFETNYGL